ncbi:hypothetical protein ScPMuIL_013426 [Solemya velum]
MEDKWGTTTRMKKSMNPDDDFVLHGQSASFWEKPSYLSNSEVTGGSRRVASHTVFNPDNYRDKSEVNMFRHNRVGRFRTTRSASPSSSMRRSMRSNMGQSKSELRFDSKPKPYMQSEWYTEPVHFPATSLEKVRHSRTAGELGSLLAIQGPNHDAITRKVRATQELENYPLTRHDFLSLRYFPVTLGSSVDESTGEIRPPSFLDSKMSRSQSALGTRSHHSKFADETFDSTKHLDSLYLMSQEAPTTASAVGSVVSPYDTDLAVLRMQRLRIEEDRLLELKRREELERIRGPKPKWYELKNPEFHYEARKNTEMVKCEKDWDSLFCYREMLLRASKEFRTQEQPALCY